MYNNINKTRDEIKEEFINSLSQPQGLWERGWFILPQERASTGIEYKGLNAFYLTMVADKKKYEDHRWFTYQQVKAMNSKNPNINIHVRKGEKGSHVEWWYSYLKQGLMSDEKYNQLLDEAYKVLGKGKNYKHQNIFNSFEKEKIKLAMNLHDDDFGMAYKNYVVFNGSQIEGLNLPYQVNIDIDKPSLAMNVIENYCMNENMTINYSSGSRAYYSLANDTITMPPYETFKDDEHYISTIFHEICHSTGAFSRLNRDLDLKDDKQRAIEEMRAELACVFLCNELDVEMDDEHINNHKSYVQSWYHAINDHKNGDKLLYDTIKEAETIVDFIKDKGLYNQCVREMQNNKEIDLLGNIDLTTTERDVSILFHCNSNSNNNDIEYIEVNIKSKDELDYTLYDSNGNLIDGGIDDCDNMLKLIDNIAKDYQLEHLSICHEDVSIGEIYYEPDEVFLSTIIDTNNDKGINESEKLLNTMSVFDCNAKEEIKHIKENDDIINQLYCNCRNFEFDVKAIGVDINNVGYNKDFGSNLSIDEAFNIYECYDIKNGIDFLTDKDGNIIMRCHGQGYEKEEKKDHKIIDIVISGYDEKKNKVDFNKTFEKVKEQIHSITKSLKI